MRRELNEHDLERALREAFSAHEHLVDLAEDHLPGAVGAQARGRPRGLVLAAAAVVAAAVIATPVVLRHDDGPGTSSAPMAHDPVPAPTSTGTAPTSRAEQLAAEQENRDLAARLAGQAMTDLTDHLEGLEVPARRVRGAEVPPLRVQDVSNGGYGDYALNRTRYFLFPSGNPTDLADAIDAHPPAGFRSEGVGGSSSVGGPWKPYVDLYPKGVAPDAPASVSVMLELAPVGEQVGLRADVSAQWRPVVPAEARLGTEVTAISVQAGKRHYDLTAPDAVASLVEGFDAMPGWPPFFHSCPGLVANQRLVVRFDTAEGRVVARSNRCYSSWDVRRDGKHVAYLADVFTPQFYDRVRAARPR